MRRQVNLANLITSGSLAAAFLALVAAAEGRIGLALIAVGVAAVLDSIDGPIARRMPPDGGFGAELDSLADHAAFGMAPAVMLYQATLHDLPGLGPAACLLYVLAGAWRLARFSALADDRHRFVGLPLPPAGLILGGAATAGLPAALVLVLLLAVATLMIGALPFPTFAGIARMLRPAARADASGGLRGRGDRRLHRRRARQRPRGRRHDGQRHPEAGDDERVGAPALARE
ncbi:MAG TPA: CDP-alcohol phosphatidyltransferase family protein [Solirubrobacteraceae bacterium]